MGATSVPVEVATGSVYVTASEVRAVLTSSHLHCGWEVTRQGQVEPCGKPAVAIRYDEDNGGLGEVCKHHTKGSLVPLSFVAEVARTLDCEVCTRPGLKPAHKAPVTGHPNHCSCSRCFG